jgi:exopolyphosphatase/pppGpp-phosphohydrolase
MINSSKQEREQMKGLDGFRVEMIVAAMVLMKVVLDIQNTQQLYISTFSLKEGLLLTYF